MQQCSSGLICECCQASIFSSCKVARKCRKSSSATRAAWILQGRNEMKFSFRVFRSSLILRGLKFHAVGRNETRQRLKREVWKNDRTFQIVWNILIFPYFLRSSNYIARKCFVEHFLKFGTTEFFIHSGRSISHVSHGPSRCIYSAAMIGTNRQRYKREDLIEIQIWMLVSHGQ